MFNSIKDFRYFEDNDWSFDKYASIVFILNEEISVSHKQTKHMLGEGQVIELENLLIHLWRSPATGIYISNFLTLNYSRVKQEIGPLAHLEYNTNFRPDPCIT